MKIFPFELLLIIYKNSFSYIRAPINYICKKHLSENITKRIWKICVRSLRSSKFGVLSKCSGVFYWLVFHLYILMKWRLAVLWIKYTRYVNIVSSSSCTKHSSLDGVHPRFQFTVMFFDKAMKNTWNISFLRWLIWWIMKCSAKGYNRDSKYYF